jgi:hypothetical protein
MKTNLGVRFVVLMAMVALAGCGDTPNDKETPDPALTGTVTIDGIKTVNETLTANITALNGSGAPSFVWKRADAANGAYTPITNATGATYIAQPGDEGKYIQVTVSRAGYTGSITSEATAQIVPVAWQFRKYSAHVGGLSNADYDYVIEDTTGMMQEEDFEKIKTVFDELSVLTDTNSAWATKFYVVLNRDLKIIVDNSTPPHGLKSLITERYQFVSQV